MTLDLTAVMAPALCMLVGLVAAAALAIVAGSVAAHAPRPPSQGARRRGATTHPRAA